MAKKTKKNVVETPLVETPLVETLASHSVLGKNRFSLWCNWQYKAQLQGKKDYAIREAARKALESEDFQSRQAQRIIALQIGDFRNGLKQGQVYHETWLRLRKDFPATFESVFKKFSEKMCGETLQVVRRKQARYLVVNQIPSAMRREAVSHLYGTVIDTLSTLPEKQFQDFLKLLANRFKVLKRQDVAEIKSGLNDLATRILNIGKESVPVVPVTPVTPEISPVVPVTGDIPPVNPPIPPEPEIEPLVEVDPIKPVTFRFPDIESLDKSDDSNGLFLQSLKAFQGLVMSLQIDPLQYLNPDITGSIQSLQKELTILTDRIRLERANNKAA